MKKFSLLLSLSLVTLNFFGQLPVDPLQQGRRYDQKDVIDSVGEIKIYSRLVASLGGDSTNVGQFGRNVQGWNEDFYASGKLLHRGYYVDGKLLTFKNFFENGQCERVLENPDPLHCLLDIFFANGSPRIQVSYYNGRPQKVHEFYENGQPRLFEENDKEMKYLTLKKSWYDNGHLKNSLELQDVKNKKYGEKSYYMNGHIKEEGPVILLSGTQDYVKDGTWFTYDREGKNKKAERHSKGIKLNSRQ